jgi:hypothetical protein
MNGSIGYYVQIIKFMFSKDNPKRILRDDSWTGWTLACLGIVIFSITMEFFGFCFLWIIGFLYSYMLYHNKTYDIFNKTNDPLCDKGIGDCLCVYNSISPCFLSGLQIVGIICLFVLIYFIIKNIIRVCKDDLIESFESAQEMTEVLVDKKTY